MKLNKNGWTLTTELIFMLVFVILLVYAIYGLNTMGLIRNMDSALSPLSKPDLIISGEVVNYIDVETKLINASKKYVSDIYSDNIVEDFITVRVNYLIKNGYINTIRDKDNEKCSGYVKVTKSGIYRAYLNCSNYKTIGYESEYDF